MLGILRIVKIFEIVDYVMLIYIKRTYSLIERECVRRLMPGKNGKRLDSRYKGSVWKLLQISKKQLFREPVSLLL